MRVFFKMGFIGWLILSMPLLGNQKMSVMFFLFAKELWSWIQSLFAGMFTLHLYQWAIFLWDPWCYENCLECLAE
jgi:hypothetical protein